LIILSSTFESIFPFRVVLNAALNLIEVFKLLAQLLELLLMILGNHPNLKGFLEASAEKVYHILAGNVA
jgi:hypothetical protein